MMADKRALTCMLTHNNDDVFSVTGFSNWKNALEKFENHQHTKSHREAMLVVSIPGTINLFNAVYCILIRTPVFNV